jgi:hypothetical protein
VSYLKHDSAADRMNAIHHRSVRRDQGVGINHGHVVECTFSVRLNPGISGDDQSDATLYESSIELKLSLGGGATLIRQPLVGSCSDHSVLEFQIADPSWTE